MNRMPANREVIPPEPIFISVEEHVLIENTISENKLRSRLIWFMIAAYCVNVLMVIACGLGLLNLPTMVVTTLVLGLFTSLFGLNGVLLRITKYLTQMNSK